MGREELSDVVETFFSGGYNVTSLTFLGLGALLVGHIERQARGANPSWPVSRLRQCTFGRGISSRN